MEFLKEDFNIRILSVLRLDWRQNDVPVAPRPYNALSFRLKGNAFFSSGGVTRRAGTHDILFMPEDVGYQLQSGEEEILVVHFTLSGKKQNCFEIFTPQNAELFRELFFAMFETWNKKKPGYYLKTVSLFYSILEKIVDLESHRENPLYEKISGAIQYMNEHFTDSELTVMKLCRLSGVSDTYFRKLFSGLYGTTPNKYLTELRLTYAKELLASGFYTVEQIAERCGFSDPKYFSTVFKKHCGVSPSAY